MIFVGAPAWGTGAPVACALFFFLAVRPKLYILLSQDWGIRVHDLL